METRVIDCSAIQTRHGLHEALARTLAFPEWYGRNLDALHDCLCSINRDTELTLLNFQAMKACLGDYCGELLYVLHDATEENPHLTISLEN